MSHKHMTLDERLELLERRARQDHCQDSRRLWLHARAQKETNKKAKLKKYKLIELGKTKSLSLTESIERQFKNMPEKPNKTVDKKLKELLWEFKSFMQSRLLTKHRKKRKARKRLRKKHS